MLLRERGGEIPSYTTATIITPSPIKIKLITKKEGVTWSTVIAHSNDM